MNAERKRIIELIEEQQSIYLKNMGGLKDKVESCWLSGCFSACTELVRQIKELK